MARSRSVSSRVRAPRARGRDRHGRGLRSSVTGPHLPMLRGRIDLFESTVADTAEYLRGLWPELSSATFEVAGLPRAVSGPGIDRWLVIPEESRIILFRLPIERLSKLHINDEAHMRMMIEGCVLRAVGELLGRDPWDLAPDRFRHH
ncbi:metallopeptidase family protein [Naasia lichenicola]|uniref:Metallopeptidase family protein n=1 Tax=Naasia lichenicola TaxID=2565933 RepID=A0A4S4FMR0_9MICO|nr:metallopeptidase family protein [Naasia lichenicola]THG30725.1 metallopeptidase family protein [Naasia lichenicola]THG31962.1 metallopeptidase family protein [Naasia lichenicola]